MEFKQQYAAYQQAIEQYLEGLFSQDKPYGRLQEAMRYSILGGGKRIRPVLTLEFARLGGIDWHLALPYACALELVHNYSLIHDDLPCMDDDDLRRGQPTTHKKFGETLAVLAGDALQPEAFRLIAEAPVCRRRAGWRPSGAVPAAGADGMVAGQVLDTLCGVSTQQELTEGDVPAENRGDDLRCGGAWLRGVGDAGGHAAAGHRPLPTSWAWPFRFGTICWMWWATRLCSASPSVPIERRGRSPSWTCWGLEGLPHGRGGVPAGPRRPSSRGRITTSC